MIIIERIWARAKWFVRRYYKSNMTELLELTNKALDSITPQDWQSAIKLMNDVIEDYMVKDNLSLDDHYDHGYEFDNEKIPRAVNLCTPNVSNLARF